MKANNDTNAETLLKTYGNIDAMFGFKMVTVILYSTSGLIPYLQSSDLEYNVAATNLCDRLNKCMWREVNRVN